MSVPLRTLLLAFTLLGGSPAMAEEPADPTTSGPDARTLFRNGEALFNEGRYEDAITAWKESYRLSEKPLLLYNIANAYERLGNLHETWEHLNKYRAYAAEDEREALGRRMLNLTARMEAAKETANTTPPKTDPVVVPVETTPITTTPVETTTKRAPVLPIVIGAVALAGYGTGIAGGVSALSARREARPLCSGSDPSFCMDSAKAPLSRDRAFSAVADAGFALGAAATVGEAVAIALAVRGQPSAVSMAPMPGGLSLHGRF